MSYSAHPALDDLIKAKGLKNKDGTREFIGRIAERVDS